MKLNVLKTKFEIFANKKFQFANKIDKICEKCHLKSLDVKIVCKACKGFRKTYNIIKDVNYFSLFGISKDFNIDKKTLDSKFKNLQKDYHPDMFHNADKDQQVDSEKCSTLINRAYQLLKNDYERANYLVSY